MATMRRLLCRLAVAAYLAVFLCTTMVIAESGKLLQESIPTRNMLGYCCLLREQMAIIRPT
jgi:hypothetical protein